MIVGVGVDLVAVSRFAASLERTPRLRARLFTDRELTVERVESLAARFAAKEAVAKALGAPGGLRWHDAEVVREDSGRPRLAITGSVAQEADGQGITAWHLSLSHDGDLAMAVVIAEG